MALTKKSRDIQGPLGTVGGFILFFVIWEILARAGVLSPLIFPKPSLIFNKVYRGLTEANYLEHLSLTVVRLVAGFVIGGGFGFLFGLVMGWSKRLRKFADPFISAVHPIPKFAFLPVIIIAFGLGESSKIIMVSVGAFFPMLINTIAGVLQIDPIHYEVAKNYQADSLAIIKKIVFPGSLPYVLSGARLSLKAALTLSVGMEMIFGNSGGLGTLLVKGWNALNMASVYSILIIVSSIGIISNLILEGSRKKLIPWHREKTSSK